MKFKFVDRATIKLIAGKGGDGCASMRREKFEEFGGPDGGDGGDGGSVIIESSRHVSTLFYYCFRGIHRAGKGKNGSSQRMAGARGKDLILRVPVGTQVLMGAEYGEELEVCDLIEHGQRFLAAPGGFGGLGNVHFKSSTNRKPVQFTRGEPGGEHIVKLALKTISDIGIIGRTNCGKSTFINKISNVKSKVGDYEFTTTRPHVGVINDNINSYVIADIPGLVEGASKGVGLGHIFLKHIEKCNLLLHIVDSSSSDVLHTYKTIRKEISEYDKEFGSFISSKPEIILLNKIDLITDEELKNKVLTLEKCGKVASISLLDSYSTEDILETINKELGTLGTKQEEFYPKSGY